MKRREGCFKKKSHFASMLPHIHGNTHYSEVLQHLSIHSALIKLVFVLGKSDVIQPTFGTKQPPSKNLRSLFIRLFALSTYEWPRCNQALQTFLAACWWSSSWLVEVFSDAVDFLAPTPGKAKGIAIVSRLMNCPGSIFLCSDLYLNWRHRFIARQKQLRRWTGWQRWQQN